MSRVLISLSVFIGFSLIVGCTSKKDSVPSWLKKTIDKHQAEASLVNVSQWEWKEKTYFYVEPPCCDRMTELYSSDGELVCHPSGGLSGIGDGKCPHFTIEAKKQKDVWKAPKLSEN